MKFLNSLLCWLPLLASAQSISEPLAEYTDPSYRLPDEEITALNITMTTPTMAQMRAAYSDLDWTDGVMGIDWIEGAGSIETANTTLTKRQSLSRLSFRLFAGSVTMIGYFTVGPGSEQVISWRKSCYQSASTGDPSDTETCWTRGVAAIGAHAFVGGVGFYGGKEFLTILWTTAVQAVADAATGSARRQLGGLSQHARRETCASHPQRYTSPAYYYNPVSLKVSVKDQVCASPSTTELGYIDAAMRKLSQAMIQAQVADAQYTIFRTSDEVIFGRSFLKLTGQVQQPCSEDITGGDDCKCTDC